jgi:hypothetical protein
MCVFTIVIDTVVINVENRNGHLPHIPVDPGVVVNPREDDGNMVANGGAALRPEGGRMLVDEVSTNSWLVGDSD